jgi:opacity protein-like surface antigen
VPTVLQAQDSVRPSLTGAASAAARKPPARPGSYNIKAGPVYVDLAGHVGVDFNDNVYLSDSMRKSDWVFRPDLSLKAFWQVTRLNSLQVDIGLGLAKYLHHHDLDSSSLLVAPNSQLSFDVYVGDFRINFHDRFSITQNPVDEALLSGVGKFDRFQNAAGVSILWDLNDLKLQAGYDHYNFWSLTSEFDTLDRAEEQFTFSASVQVNEEATAGIDTSASIIDYDKNYQNDGWSGSAGPFVEMQVTNYLKFRASGGYQTMVFDGGGENQDSSDYQGWFAYLNLSHRLNSRITHGLSMGHEARLGLMSNYTDVTYVRYTAAWQMNSKLSAAFDGLYEDSRESDIQLGPEDAQRYSVGLGLTYTVNSKMTLGLRYRFSQKDSNLPRRDYYQNVVSADLNYNF